MAEPLAINESVEADTPEVAAPLIIHSVSKIKPATADAKLCKIETGIMYRVKGFRKQEAGLPGKTIYKNFREGTALLENGDIDVNHGAILGLLVSGYTYLRGLVVADHKRCIKLERVVSNQQRQIDTLLKRINQLEQR